MYCTDTDRWTSYSVSVTCFSIVKFLQRISIACYAERCKKSYDRFRPSVCLSDRLSQAGIMSKRLKLRSWDLHCYYTTWS